MKKSTYCIFLIIFFLFISYSYNILAKNRTCNIFIINNDKIKIPLKVELALDEESQARGLMFRDELGHDSGMLFVYKKEIRMGFWMKNTYIPLSLAYINKKGIIKEIYDMKPLDTSIIYRSENKVMYVLEVNQGWFKLNNIQTGSKIVFNGCFGKQN